jgi:hypothetical protein
MIAGLIILLLSPLHLILALNSNLMRLGIHQIPDYDPIGIIVEENVAYLTGTNIFQIMSVNDPNFIFQLGRLELNGSASSLFKSGDRIYVPIGNDGFQIINVSNILTPISFGIYYNTSKVWDIFVSDWIAYVPVDGVGLDILNVTDPKNVTLLGSYHDGAPYATQIYVDNTIAYLGESNNRLKILDISNPTNPQLIGYYEKIIYDIYVKDSIAYLVSTDDEGFWGIEIVDMSNPSAPALLSQISLKTYDIFVSQDYIYTPIEYDEVIVFDVSDMENPKRVGQYPFPSRFPIPRGDIIYNQQNYIYLCTSGTTGYLHIIDQDKTALVLRESGITYFILTILVGVITILISRFRERSEKNSIDYYLRLYQEKKACINNENPEG